jgi:hypothetical protein
MGTWQGALGLQEGNLAWLRHEAFGLEVANHLGAFAGGEFAVDVDEALAVGLEDGDDLLAVVDLELGDEFAVGGGIASGEEEVFGVASGVGDGGEKLFVEAALLAAEPVEAADEDGDGNSRGHSGSQGEEKQIIRSEAGDGSGIHTDIRIPQRGRMSK